ncbi:hypothetical protein [Streptacidiphilus melanogenes]|uniref:hypothetical protein n=1 Tax=Streptacidiphilus melanogenes TaxID=411235 RepID=UPI00126A2301|nr:hypothetical protein [Streptacidiphilus melanogenes]
MTNALRQTGTAPGVAVSGTIAGSGASPDRFVARPHDLAALGGALWLAAPTLTVFAVPTTRGAEARCG